MQHRIQDVDVSNTLKKVITDAIAADSRLWIEVAMYEQDAADPWLTQLYSSTELKDVFSPMGIEESLLKDFVGHLHIEASKAALAWL